MLRADSASPAQNVQQDFIVTLSILPVYQVTQLKDVILYHSDKGEWIFEDMKFCVYALGGGGYKMSLGSRLRPSEPFTVQNASASIPYRVSILQTNGHWKVLSSAGATDPKAMKGSRELDCSDKLNPTVRIEIRVRDTSGKPSGTYSDVMEVTVGPE